ncbi:MAG: carbohydrate ABC transporter permease [Myxococcaceae bacterium]
MKKLGLGFAVFAAVTFCLGPALWQLLTSLRPEAELTSLAWPSRISFESYAGVVIGRSFGQSLLNSVVVAGGTTLFCLLLGAPAAFALSKLDFKGRRVLLLCALAVSMFPPIATVSPLFLLVRSLGLRDSLVGLMIPYVTFALPMTVWVLTSFLDELPLELYRAARIDGCSPLQAFLHVFLPLSTPGLATTGLLVFIAAWNEFLYALTFISSPSKRTVPVAISLFATDQKEPWGQMAAASILVTLPLVALTWVFQKRIISGLTAGAVKG